MGLALDQLHDLPSPFYRVAVKAVILDNLQRMLVVINEDGEAELPGGGWEHGETLEECVARELQEEAGAILTTISPVEFVFQSTSDHGWRVIRVVVRATLAPGALTAGDDMMGVRWVTRDELSGVLFDQTDAPIVQYADKIWSNE